jgi:hypothetical protein
MLARTLARVVRASFAASLALAPLLACGAGQNVGAQGTKPDSPATGAKDYDVTPGGEPTGTDATGLPPSEGSSTAAAATPPDCPPKCTGDNVWVGCGLKKPRGSKCAGCTPKCKKKGTVDEGWYDCTGVLIVQANCSDTASP